MRNEFKLKAVLLVLVPLLGALPHCAGQSAYDLCTVDEDVLPSRSYINHPECWDKPYIWRRGMPCNCGFAYQVTDAGTCRRGFCSPGYSANEKGDCLHCPDKDEMWCSYTESCICRKNHHRDQNNHCIPCAANEVSDGNSKCQCKPFYTYDRQGVCHNCGPNAEPDVTSKKCICSYDYARNEATDCVYCASPQHEIRDTSEDKICSCIEGYQLNAQNDCEKKKIQFGHELIIYGCVLFAFMGLMFGYVVNKHCHDRIEQCSSSLL
ncbi:hypothetical protein KR222_009539 [Zaprionus bogoriensis]|nr:hypothetical protein KR222_009539 [Zaprionus bogoriensis]